MTDHEMTDAEKEAYYAEYMDNPIRDPFPRKSAQNVDTLAANHVQRVEAEARARGVTEVLKDPTVAAAHALRRETAIALAKEHEGDKINQLEAQRDLRELKARPKRDRFGALPEHRLHELVAKIDSRLKQKQEPFVRQVLKDVQARATDRILGK